MAVVTIKRPTGLITIGKNQEVAILQRLNTDGFFEYSVHYEADPVKCIRERISTVKISVSSVPYVRQMIPVFAGVVQQDPRVFTANLLAQSSRQKDAARSQSQNYLLSIFSDITARIPNDLIRTIARTPLASTTPIRVVREVNTIPVSSLEQSSVNAPVLEMNLAGQMLNVFNNDSNQGENNASFQRAANTILSVNQQDPAAVAGRRTNTIVSARTSFGGLIPRRPAGMEQRALQNPLAQTLIRAGTTPNQLTSQIELGPRDVLPVVVQRTISSVHVSETLLIPASSLTSSEFYLVFEVLGAQGELIEVLSVLVEHAKNFSQLNLVTEPPVVEKATINKPGKVTFYLKQVDENAFGVKVFRRELKPNVSALDAIYSMVGKIELQVKDGMQRFEDPVASLSPIIYRFVPYNREEVLCADFASLVVNFEKPTMFLHSPVFQRSKNVSFNCQVKNSSIDIQIISIPSEPVVLKLVRRDKTIKEQDWKQVSDKILLKGIGNGSLFVEDKDVKKNHIYEYACVLGYKDGSEEMSGISVLQEFKPVERNIISMELLDPKIVQTQDGWDATFTIDYSLLRDNSELIRDYLRQQGIYGEFYQEILSSKDKLNKVFGFEVTRTNLNTSEVESCGIIDSLQFSDKKYGSANGLRPLQPGFEYKYTVSAFFRNPETLFSATRDVPVRAGSQVTYALAPRKWRHPVTLNEGNLVSERTLSRNHSASEMTFGSLAESKTVTLSISKTLPTVQSAQVTKVKDGCLYLQWRVQGNTSMIDHFLIGMDVLGLQQNIGKSHNISSTGYFQMLDKLLNGESGAISYLITPVYFDYSKGPTTKTNQVVI